MNQKNRSGHLNLHQRTLVDPLRIGEIIHDAEQNPEARDQDTVIHRRGVDLPRRRPEAEEDDDEHVQAPDDVDGDARGARQAEGSPGQVDGALGADGFALGDDLGAGFVDGRQGDGARATAPEEETGGEEVG